MRNIGRHHLDSVAGEIARHIIGPGALWQGLLLINLQRQTVRIVKKGESLTGEGVDTNAFTSYAVRLKMGNGGINIVDAKCQMA